MLDIDLFKNDRFLKKYKVSSEESIKSDLYTNDSRANPNYVLATIAQCSWDVLSLANTVTVREFSPEAVLY